MGRVNFFFPVFDGEVGWVGEVLRVKGGGLGIEFFDTFGVVSEVRAYMVWVNLDKLEFLW